MSTPERIAYELLHGGDLADWSRRLPNRPDWQAAILTVQEILAEQSE